ncbi:MAG: hypothetical protein ACE5GO_11620, partial [Anaerolineales bacterium]
TLDELESTLVYLRQRLEKIPWIEEPIPGEDGPDDADLVLAEDLEEMFKAMREVWNIPPDFKPTVSFAEVRPEMGKGLPENWASREIIRMREE